MLVKLLFVLSISFLSAHVEIVKNGVGVPEGIEIIPFDFSNYPGLIKNKSPWGKVLRKLGFEKSQIDVEASKIVFMNIPLHGKRDLNLFRLPKEKMILFMWEPEIRLSEMYKQKIQDCFSKIYTWDDDLVDNVKYFKFHYSVLRPMIENIIPFEEKKFCTMVIGNAGDLPNSNELYSHRKKAIRFFEAIGETGFNFYGKNWDAAEYPSYLGPIEDKTSVIKTYKFIICYENCRGLNGYITEKIFDAFHAGIVPIYWGADNIEKYVPHECFIDRRNFESLDSLYAFLKAITKDEYETYLMHIRTYLESPQAEPFSCSAFKQLFSEISDF